MLERVDLTQRLDREAYRKQLRKLQVDLHSRAFLLYELSGLCDCRTHGRGAGAPLSVALLAAPDAAAGEAGHGLRP